MNDRLNTLNLNDEFWLHHPILTYDEAGFAIEGELFVRNFYVVCRAMQGWREHGSSSSERSHVDAQAT